MTKKDTYSSSYLDQLSPPEVFQILEKAAKVSKGTHMEPIKIVFSGPPPYKYVALEVPDPYGNEQMPEEEQTVYITMVNAYKDLTGRGEVFELPGGTARPLHEGIARLLLESANEADEPSADESSEFLVVTRPIKVLEAEGLFKNLNFHATYTRVSSWGSNETNDENGKTYETARYMFHVKADRQRKSSFTSIQAGGSLGKYQVLQGYDSDGDITFLPEKTAPGERKLKHFGRLVNAAPQLFGKREERDSYGLLAAVHQWPAEEEPKGKLEFFYLGKIRFFQQDRLTERKVRDADFHYYDLKESRRSLQRLNDAVKQSEPYVGYRLELRPTKQMEKNRLGHLMEQKARIEYNLAYLQSINKPRPVLMRFTHKQLPALAAQIRSFPLQVVYDGSIRYGFQATPSEPSGYHFIMINPAEATRIELDPLPLFQDLDIPHMKFHLDPFWARHYFDTTGSGTKGTLVYVPEGCALFPSIHSWKGGNIEFHLRETMEQWFKDQLEGDKLPGRAIYIFDGKPQPKSTINIFVLDWDRFEPLHTRLGWINDNLIVHKHLEKEELIKEIARDVTWTELAQTIKTRLETTRRDFSGAAHETSRHMAQTTTQMTQVLTTEIDRIVKESFRMTQRIRKMDQRLQEWDAVLEDMVDMLQDLRQKKQNLTYQQGHARNEFARLEQEVERDLRVVCVVSRSRVRLQRDVPGVLHHSDDLEHLFRAGDRVHALPDGVLVLGEEPPHEGLVDHHRQGRSGPVALGQVAAARDLHPHHREVVGRDGVVPVVALLAFLPLRLAFDLDAPRPLAVLKGQELGDPRPLDPGHGPQLPYQVVVQGRLGLRVAVPLAGQGDVHRDDPARIPARVDGHQGPERGQHEAGRDQQQGGERELRDHERATDPDVPLRAPGPAAALLEPLRHVESDRVQCRKKPEHEP